MNLSNLLSNSIFSCLLFPVRKRTLRAAMPALQTNLDGIVFRQACSVDDYTQCFKLLHDVYVHAGFTKPSGIPLRIIPHHYNPESRVFLGCVTDPQDSSMPVYTASLFPDNPNNGLPMDIGFRKQVDALRAKGRKIAEVGCLASHPAHRKGDRNIPMLGNRMILSYAVKKLGVDDLLITVHPKYLKIYEDILLFEKIGQISSYSYVNGNPAVALKLNLNTLAKRLKQVYGHRPIQKNLYHFFIESESTSIDLSLDDEKTTVYGSDMIRLVFNAYFPVPLKGSPAPG